MTKTIVHRSIFSPPYVLQDFCQQDSIKLKSTTTSLSPMCLDISVRINPNLIRFDKIRKYDDRIFFGLTLYDILNSCEFNHKSLQISEQYKTALPEGHLDARHLAIKWSTLGKKY